jgi:hypothetical protein
VVAILSVPLLSLPGAHGTPLPSYDLGRTDLGAEERRGTANGGERRRAGSGGTTNMIDGIGDLLADEGFRTGLRFGLLAVLAAMVPGALLRRVGPWAGLAFVVAGLLAIDDAFVVERPMVVAVAVLLAGGLAAVRFHPLVWLVAAAPGALLFVESTELDDPTWAYGTILVTTLVGGLLMADFDKAFARTGLPPIMLAITLLGAYVTTPETQHTILLTGAALPLVLLGWPWPLGSLGVGGSFAVTAIVTWTIVLDGSFRPSSVVGGIASLGLFAVEPVVRRLRPGVASPPVLVVGGLHLVVVGLCSRVAGLRSSTALALVITAVVYVAAGAALVVLGRRAEAGPAADELPRGTSAFRHTG